MTALLACDTIRDWLLDRCGIEFADHKAEMLAQRLAGVAQEFGFAGLDDLAHALTTLGDHRIELAVAHAASTNHTYFYREQDVLNRLVRDILPGFDDRSELRIWSAAASSGDEAYSVAMAVAELRGADHLGRLRILGTDLSAPVIEQAEAGVYSQRHLDQVPDDVRARYFRPQGDGTHLLGERIRATCTFRRLNLKAAPYPFSYPFQAVLCRNLLYYLSRDDQIAVLAALYQVTEPGGCLVTSVTESIRGLQSGWQPVAPGIYRRPA